VLTARTPPGELAHLQQATMRTIAATVTTKDVLAKGRRRVRVARHGSGSVKKLNVNRRIALVAMSDAAIDSADSKPFGRRPMRRGTPLPSKPAGGPTGN